MIKKEKKRIDNKERKNMKIAVTGFLPFNGRDINPSQLIVEKLTAPQNCTLVKRILSVEYKKSSEELYAFLDEEKPDVLLSIGQAGNSPYLSVERVAINLDNAKTSDGKALFADQSGATPVDEKIDENGPTAYFASLPVWDIINAINEKEVMAKASYSAGTFICNHIMYEGLRYAEACKNMKSGFIHVPFLPEQLKGNTKPGCYEMPLEKMVAGIQIALEVIQKCCD